MTTTGVAARSSGEAGPEPESVEEARSSPTVGGVIGPLVELAVTNLGLIDRLRLVLDPGLNVLTGETGAGKSLVIDALGLAIGARADVSLVRHGAASARVEALFDRIPEPLIVVRDIAASGRSTARLDDEAVTASRLADVAGRLVEVHGQHDQGRLLDERWQRDLLDAFGGHVEARTAVAEAVGTWRENRTRLAGLSIEPRELARRLELLEHEVAEIEGANLRPGEADDLRARLGAARQGATIAAAGDLLHQALDGDEQSARTLIAQAIREVRSLARIDARFEALAARLSGMDADLEDITSEVRALLGSVDHDAGAVAGLEARLSDIYALERRYGEDEAAVLAHAERAAEEVTRLRGLDGERDRRVAEDARLLTRVADAASVLGARRRGAATRLRSATESVLVALGFPADAFEVTVGRRIAAGDEAAIEIDGDSVAFDASGADEVVFMLAPNLGEPARPLSRIASGGELSRVALAIKQVLAEADDTPTLVFDEIDTGIGGRSADPIGRSLWALARRHQVLVVTHLPQIAAYADAHLHIRKGERDGRTVTSVDRLAGDERVAELAAMLGGSSAVGPAPTALAQARELLNAASAWTSTARGDA